MTTKHFLILISLGALLGLCGLIILMLTYFESGAWLLELGFSISGVLGQVMLIRNGTLTKTIYFKFIMFCWAIITIGALFKIMHWPGGAIMLTVGTLGITVIYTIRFIKKTTKTQLDIMKWVWVVVAYTSGLCLIMHWIPRPMMNLSNLIMLATVIHFASTCMKDKTLLES